MRARPACLGKAAGGGEAEPEPADSHLIAKPGRSSDIMTMASSLDTAMEEKLVVNVWRQGYETTGKAQCKGEEGCQKIERGGAGPKAL